MKLATGCATACILLLSSVVACAGEVSHSLSYCLDPPSVKATAGTEEDKKKFPQCARWSEFAQIAVKVDDPGEFVMANCGSASGRPLNLYARDVVNQLRAAQKLAPISEWPSTIELYTNPAHFGLRELLPGESRVNSLAVWRSSKAGMLGLVYEDRSPTDVLVLEKLMIRYPGNAADPRSCGTIRDADAATVLKESQVAEDARKRPKFLTTSVPTLFWNYWVEKTSGAERPPNLDAGASYVFRLSLSSLDYSSWNAGRATDLQRKLTPEQAARALPDVDNSTFTVTVLLSPPLELVGNVSNAFDIMLSGERLRASLVNPPGGDTPTRTAMARGHDAIDASTSFGPNRTRDGIRLPFRVADNAPCAAVDVIVQDQSGRPVSSWSLNIRLAAARDGDCAVSGTSARRLDVVSAFDVALNQEADAHLAFVEVAGSPPRTIGIFAERGAGPLRWRLNAPLTTRLDDYAKQINQVIGNSGSFSLLQWSRKLGTTLLFECATALDDAVCDGTLARERLVALANSPDRKRLQVSLRTSSNSRLYLPATIIGLPDDQLLGQKVDLVQALAQPGTQTAGSCVDSVSGGFLIAEADDSVTKDWREQWWTAVSPPPPARYKDFGSLRAYLSAAETSAATEALVVMAHHGAAGISNVESGGDLLPPEEIRRKFNPSSFAVLAMCSVGAQSSDAVRYSGVLDRLNAANVRAIIASPYALPLSTAKTFLSHFRAQLMAAQQDRTLREIFNATRAAVRAATRAPDKLANPSVETFMLLGDGDVRVCKTINRGGTP
jgi:hypothetical protein